MFSDTVTLGRRTELAAERAAVSDWVAQGGGAAAVPFPFGRASRALAENATYEHFKIAAGFELHLKARLLAADVLLHKIDQKTPGLKSLAGAQRGRPIAKAELLSKEPYRFDGRQNYLPGLGEESINFSWILDTPAYRAKLGLTAEELDVVADYRVLRNRIHLPVDGVETPAIRALRKPLIEFLLAFINSRIFAWSNALIAQHSMNRPPLDLVELLPNPSLNTRPSAAGRLARQAGGHCRPVGQGSPPLRAR